jgi:cyclase
VTVAVRVIPCLDVDGGRVVKGVNFVNLRDAGDPVELAARYDAEGADELTFLDITASSGGRETMYDVVRRTADQVFIPLTVGGGVRSTADVDALLRAGADKVGLNTAAIARPELLREAAHQFGSQCVVLSVDARRVPAGAPPTASGFEVTTHGGRRGTGIDAIDWSRRAVDLGAGEILLNSMDADGTQAGFDTELIGLVRAAVTVPVIASGGAGEAGHFPPAISAGADAVLAASVFHFGALAIADVKQALREAGHTVRLPDADAGGGHGGADDAGVIEQGGGDDLRADAGQQRHPLVRLLADAAADDDQARRQQRLHVPHVLIDPSGPLGPGQVVQYLGPLRRPLLGVLAVDLQVAELGVGHQGPLGEQRAADPGAERQHQHRAADARPRAEGHLGDAGRVGVVQDRHRAAQRLARQRPGEQARRVGADP